MERSWKRWEWCWARRVEKWRSTDEEQLWIKTGNVGVKEFMSKRDMN